jgi:arginine/lysine/ornithine decarboxylase
LREQERIAEFFGAKRSFFLVNGSTCGILAAISATVERGKKILIARNSHKSAYHALYLMGLSAVYLYPDILPWDIQGSIRPGQVQEALAADSSIEAVYITSPTYDGVVSDVEDIARIVHHYGKILIVDEAHGAHFGLHSMFPASAIGKGADLVIQSVHKTLTCLTQSALLHVCSDRVDPVRLAQLLAIYETSSPSYVLMESMSRLVPFLESRGAEQFGALEKNLDWFYRKMRTLSRLHVMERQEYRKNGAFDQDISKIMICTANTNINGKQLYDRLLRDYHLQMEMCSGEYVTALCSLMDSREGFERLAAALLEIDGGLERTDKQEGFVRQVYRERTQRMSIAEGMDMPTEARAFEESVGRISGEFAYLYPPGIPILVPGEEIDETLIRDIGLLRNRGMELEGMEDFSGSRIRVGL